MYKFKTLAKRGSALAGAVGLLAGIGTSALPAFVSADALNPLTERSLTLSSSSPGWSYTDGSGNSTYAPPHSGANGLKTGETYSFRMSSNSKTVKAMTFLFCITPAGDCTAPGNDTGAAGSRVEGASQKDLDVVLGNGTTTVAPAEISSSDWSDISNPTTTPSLTPPADGSKGSFVLLWGDTSAGHTKADTYSGAGDWAMTAANGEAPSQVTGRNNEITLTSTTGQAIDAQDYFKVVFFGTDDNYITNPGNGAFFVRINTYSSATTLDDTTLIDGGVTVANVMNESITIQTKVLETMDFSVGTYDPDTVNDSVLSNVSQPIHGQCNTLLMANPNVADASAYNAQPHNVLKMGDSTAEYSLKTGTAYDQQSYWRLSSNSSGGATVYYTGHTLTNTVGDEIKPLDETSGGTSSNPGTEQFGLAIAHGSDTTIPALSGSEAYPVDGDTYGSTSTAGDFAKYVSDGAADVKSHLPRLYPLQPLDPYDGGAGTISSGGTAKFAFNAHADSNAVPIASENTDVVNCVTAKMRYIANIAATTPAGIYTTKVNYVASPQY